MTKQYGYILSELLTFNSELKIVRSLGSLLPWKSVGDIIQNNELGEFKEYFAIWISATKMEKAQN